MDSNASEWNGACALQQPAASSNATDCHGESDQPVAAWCNVNRPARFCYSDPFRVVVRQPQPPTPAPACKHAHIPARLHAPTLAAHAGMHPHTRTHQCPPARNRMHARAHATTHHLGPTHPRAPWMPSLLQFWGVCRRRNRGVYALDQQLDKRGPAGKLKGCKALPCVHVVQYI